jgi:hypothetical protein
MQMWANRRLEIVRLEGPFWALGSEGFRQLK